MELVELLIEFLPNKKERAVTQSAVSTHLGISKRNVRQLVQQARHLGYPICSTPYDGYWLSFSEEDIESTLAILRSQVNTLYRTIHDLETCSKCLEGVSEE